MDAPILVNFPKPSSAKGQMPAQISELAKPNNTTKQMLMSTFNPASSTLPDVINIPKENTKPRMVQVLSAITWLTYFGMHMIPMMYPQIVAASVNEGKILASMSWIFIDPA